MNVIIKKNIARARTHARTHIHKNCSL